MTLITEIRGVIFSVVLSDNTTLTLQAGDSVTIKNELVSDSLKEAEKRRCVTLSEVVTEKKSSNKKNGGAVDNE